jgi:ribosomal protein S18 acetylase RimI-like enzyme
MTGVPSIRSAREDELAELHDIFSLAFSTHFGRPIEMFGDRKLIEPRWRTDPQSVLVAELDGRVVGSNVATIWGRFGWFGPLTVHPDYWDRGIAQALMVPTMQRFAEHGTTTEALFTFPSSPKHIGLYQRYGFWPRRLTASLARLPEVVGSTEFVPFSTLSADAQQTALGSIRSLCARIIDGFDPTAEVAAVAKQRLGETLIVRGSDGAVAAFAICHHGAGSEAGSIDLSVKFGAAADGSFYQRLLDAVLSYGAVVKAERVVLAVNAAREGAYRATFDRGFRIAMLGVAMVRGDVADDPAAWLIEDYR